MGETVSISGVRVYKVLSFTIRIILKVLPKVADCLIQRPIGIFIFFPVLHGIVSLIIRIYGRMYFFGYLSIMIGKTSPKSLFCF